MPFLAMHQMFSGGKMVNFKQVLSGLVLMGITCCAQAGEQEIRESFTKNLPEVKLGAITKLPYGGLYQVIFNGTNIAYTDEKGEVGLFGNLVDLKSKISLTKLEKEKITAIDFSKLPLDKAIVRVKGTGARKLALFSDPECPFCQGIEKELESVNDVTIYTFLLPLTDLHPDALRKAQLIWCAKDKAKAWEDMLVRQKEPQGSNTSCATPIKEIAEFAANNWINGTPGVVFTSGKLLFGNQPHEIIEEQLSAAVQ
jgi:thiol:disulfide interchange protein DsbC